jgi:hypothetical protein
MPFKRELTIIDKITKTASRVHFRLTWMLDSTVVLRTILRAKGDSFR